MGGEGGGEGWAAIGTTGHEWGIAAEAGHVWLLESD